MSEPHIRFTDNRESAGPDSVSKDTGSVQSAELRFLEHYGLIEQPFGVTPDPRFLYFGSKHRQALAALTYGTELNRGFLTLIAKPGMGKTSLLFQYLGALRNARTAFLFQTMGDSRDLMSYLLTDLGLNAAGKDLPEMHSILNHVLLEEIHAGRRLILVIDEAQNLDEKVLESVRLLSNFETPWSKPMQIVLAGQPQLAEKLALPSMAQFRQRVSFSIPIEPLNREEVDAYVDHRLWVAGYSGASLFSTGARMLLAAHSEGIPRNIGNLCFCAMSLGWATRTKTIDREMMREVLTDMNSGSPSEKTAPPPKFVEEHKQVAPVTPRRPVLTVKEAGGRRWLTKIGIACVVLFALGWVGSQSKIGQQLVFSLHNIGAMKTSAAPTPVPASVDPPAPASHDNSSSYATSETSTEDKNLSVSHPGEVQSAVSSRNSK